MDSDTDLGTDSDTWLTYAELAQFRGIDRHSAVKLVSRHGWRRQKDNRGTLRVLVPAEWAVSRDEGTDNATDRGTDIVGPPGWRSELMAALDALAGLMRGQLDQANKRAEAAEATSARERARADAAETAAELARRCAQDAAQAAETLRQATTRGGRGGAGRGSGRHGGVDT